MARDAGANKVYLRVGRAAGEVPERVRHRHADARRAVAHGRTDDEIARMIGADQLSIRTSTR